MRYIFLSLLLLTIKAGVSQDCTKELLRQKPGTWKASSQGFIQNVSAADLVKEKAVIAGIHKMVSTGYHPTGCQVSYSTVYGKHLPAGKNWIADPYYYAMFVLRYLCDPASGDKTKSYVDYSTPTTVNITANVINWFNLYAAGLPDDDFRGYLKLRKKPEKKDGYYYLGEEVMGDADDGKKIKEYHWLITYSDTLPFSYMTRKEYLLIQKKRLEKNIMDSPSEKSYNEKFISNINEYLKKSDKELNQPAISRWNDEERFEGFVEEGSSNSFIAIKYNPDYYHKKLARSVPQFFTVVYKISHGDPVFEENIEAIKKAVDFAALKSRLGK
ncbi:MAG: hypothetical protein ABI480_15475 [Chitinophagaceae bacterium]